MFFRANDCLELWLRNVILFIFLPLSKDKLKYLQKVITRFFLLPKKKEEILLCKMGDGITFVQYGYHDNGFFSPKENNGIFSLEFLIKGLPYPKI